MAHEIAAIAAGGPSQVSFVILVLCVLVLRTSELYALYAALEFDGISTDNKT